MGDTYPFNDNKYAKKAAVRPETAEPVERILHKIRRVCEKRGSDGFKGLSKVFNLYDTDCSNTLKVQEVKTGLARYGIDLTQDESNTVFAAFDLNHDGMVNLTEFLRGIKPELSANRINLIEQAFKKMDKSGDGVISMEDLVGTYNLESNPKFRAGQMTAEECYKGFLDSFQQNSETKDDKVTIEEFKDYYAGVSASIDKDVYFDFMMRTTWKL